MRKVVLESPFSSSNGHTIEENIAYAKRCVRDCLSKGDAPIASHLLFTQRDILNDANPQERTLGIAAGHAWIAVADALVVYTNLGITIGMQAGMAEAQRHGVKIEYRVLPQDDIKCPRCGNRKGTADVCDECLLKERGITEQELEEFHRQNTRI